MKIGILVFPGTNCEQDIKLILEKIYNITPTFLWYSTSFEDKYDLYFVPGGFSYGDYLRSGALAKMATSMSSLKEAVKHGKKIIGICNGFQILTEAGILPGALVKNKNLKHICEWVELKSNNPILSLPNHFSLPISHSEGNYICDNDTLKSLEDNQQILLQYKNNPNGSTKDIAGIIDKNKKIIGLMPHPERACFSNMDIPDSNHYFGKYFLDTIFSL